MSKKKSRQFNLIGNYIYIISVIFIIISICMVPVSAVDTTAPVTTDNSSSVWTNYDQTILLTATDDDSGVSATTYCVYDGLTATTCTPDLIGTTVDITCNSDTAGIWYIKYYSTDNLGNNETTKTSTAIKIDKFKPTTYDSYNAKDNIWQNTDQEISLTPTDYGAGRSRTSTKYCVGSISCTPLNTYTGPLQFTDEGTTYLRYATTDKVGNLQDTVTVTIKIDKTSPVVYAGTDRTTDIEILQTSMTLDTDSGITSYNWTNVSGQGTITFGNSTEETTTISADTDGTYIIRLTVIDDAGNTDYDEMTLIWDTILPLAPNITLLKPITFVNQESVTITGTGEPNTIIDYLITDSISNNIAGTSTVDSSGNINIIDIDVSTLSDGTLTVSATLTDMTSNTGPIGVDNATKDTIVPTAPIVTLLDYINIANEKLITITGTGEANTDLSYSIDDTNSLTPAITGTSSVSIDSIISISDIDVSALDDGTLSLSVTLTDAVGNIGLIGTDTSTKDTVAPTAPTITLLDPITNTNKDAVTITGTGEPNTTIDYLIIDSLSANITGNSTVNISGNINIGSIDVSTLSDGTLTVSVTLTDTFGNIGLAATDNATKDTYVAPPEEPSNPSNGGSYTIEPYCGDAICQEEPYDPRTDEGCESDCGVVEYCGDGICQNNENYKKCSADCVNDKVEKTQIESIPAPTEEEVLIDTSTIDTINATDTPTTESQVSPLTGFATANLDRLKDSDKRIIIILILFIVGIYLLKKHKINFLILHKKS